MSGRKGFTLIELLVVVAIIAILAAVLFPIFMAAKKRGQMAACQSNMRQCASAMLLYADDNAGFLPMSHWGPVWQSDDADAYWGKAIRKYCASKKEIVYCPGVPSTWKVTQDFGDQNPGWQYYWGTSIGMNVALGMEANGAWVRPTKLSDVYSCTRTIMLGDSSLYSVGDFAGYESYKQKGAQQGHWAIAPGGAPALGRLTWLNPSQWQWDFFDPNRHGGKVNIACVDGHVSSKDRKWLLTAQSKSWKDPNFTWWDVNSDGSARLNR